MGGCGDFIKIEAITSSLQETAEKAQIDETLFQVYLNKQSDVRKCPKSGCSYAGVIHASPDCTEPLNCELCGTIWRDKQYSALQYESLGEYFEKLMLWKDEVSTALWKRLWSGKCPNCKTRIEKNGGCDHMTCKKCKHEFCWICSVQHPHHNNLIHQAKFLLKIVKVIVLIIAVLATVYFSGRLIYAIPFVGTICDYTIVPVINLGKRLIAWAWPMLWRFVLANAVVILILALRVSPGKVYRIQCIGMALLSLCLFLIFGGFYSLMTIYLVEAGIGLTIALGLHLHRKIKIYLRDSDFELPKLFKRKGCSYQMLVYGQDSVSNTALSIV